MANAADTTSEKRSIDDKNEEKGTFGTNQEK